MTTTHGAAGVRIISFEELALFLSANPAATVSARSYIVRQEDGPSVEYSVRVRRKGVGLAAEDGVTVTRPTLEAAISAAVSSYRESVR